MAFDDDDGFDEGQAAEPGKPITLSFQISSHNTNSLAGDIARYIANSEALDLKGVKARLEKRIEAAIDGALKQGISDRVNAMLDDLLHKQIGMVDQWGAPTGKVESLYGYIEKAFSKALNDTVDNSGNPSTFSGSIKRLDWLIKKNGTAELMKAAEGEITKVRREAEKQIAAAVGNFIAQNLVAPIAAAALPKTSR